MPETLFLAVGLALAGLAVLAPLLRRAPESQATDDVETRDARQADAIRRRVALEALRDLEADRRAGSLDDAAYARLVAEAEADAAAAASEVPQAEAPAPGLAGRRPSVLPAVLAAVLIGVAILGGSVVPGSGLANSTVVDQALADARAADEARQARIEELLTDLAADPTDPETLSALADAYLAGSSGDELARAAAALQVLISVEPQRGDAYERLMTAYLRAGDYMNARAVHDSYAAVDGADTAELAFFDGLIALRGENDPQAAVEALDRFLELAPDDPRVPMIRGLRDEAAAEANGS